jgi:endogenous inhibitor of DNA gyrase (YacG/DUF329 family)
MSASTSRCPICSKPATPNYHPFCCRRCADVDLGRWFIGSYAIETDDDPRFDTDESPENSPS